jgi:hypothetical protein
VKNEEEIKIETNCRMEEFFWGFEVKFIGFWVFCDRGVHKLS